MIKPSDLKRFIIISVLKKIGLYSESATNLLLGTAAQESQCGYYLVQLNQGPAKGIYQMEEATHEDIWKNYLIYHPNLAALVKRMGCVDFVKMGYFITDKGKLMNYPSPLELIGNLYYATAMARVHYFRVKEALPKSEDIQGLARYYKIYFNTNEGKATTDDFIANYKKYEIDKI